jgi:glycosyltransferase involved in cell wall biosynthesis
VPGSLMKLVSREPHDRHACRLHRNLSAALGADVLRSEAERQDEPSSPIDHQQSAVASGRWGDLTEKGRSSKQTVRRLLLITRAFPPQKVVGAIRPLKFVRYLPEFGWQPVVLTVKDGHTWQDGTDPTFLEEIPPVAEIVRTPTIEPPYRTLAPIAGEPSERSAPWYKRILRAFRALFLVPDDKIGWLPFAVQAGVRILRDKPVDLILATSPPPTALIIGALLSTWHKVPLVTDFRDPWTEFTFHNWLNNPLRRQIEETLEFLVVQRSARIINVTPPRTRALAARHPDVPGERFVTVTNGFDFHDYGPPAAPPENDRLTMVYTGSFYYDREPVVFLDSLTELIEHYPSVGSDLRVVFAGSGQESLDQLIGDRNLEEVVRTAGYLPYSESVALQKQADVLLLFLGTSPISTSWYPAKIFEYLATGRPVLAMVPEGAAADLLREAGTGIVVNPTERHAIQRALVTLHRRWIEDSLPRLKDMAFPMQFERRRLTKKLADELDAAIAESSVHGRS